MFVCVGMSMSLFMYKERECLYFFAYDVSKPGNIRAVDESTILLFCALSFYHENLQYQVLKNDKSDSNCQNDDSAFLLISKSEKYWNAVYTRYFFPAFHYYNLSSHEKKYCSFKEF
jgi:hypothetical protein